MSDIEIAEDVGRQVVTDSGRVMYNRRWSHDLPWKGGDILLCGAIYIGDPWPSVDREWFALLAFRPAGALR